MSKGRDRKPSSRRQKQETLRTVNAEAERTTRIATKRRHGGVEHKNATEALKNFKPK